MERTQFLQMCQKVSLLECKNIPDDLMVCHDGITYFPYAYEMKFEKGVPIHNAILRDKNANAIIYVKLERVENYEQK